MPNLDGVSACHLIRQFDNTPIIAMTSNIRSDDISMYFHHGNVPSSPVLFHILTGAGMNDVLPKPFTKEGLLNMLEKHLGHLKKMPDGMEAMVPQPMNQNSGGHSLKDESSPNQSPSTISNWQSPGNFNGISPTHSGPPNAYMQPINAPPPYGMEQSPMQYQPPHTPLGGPRPPQQHRRQISELAGADDLSNDPKRQRMYPQTNPLPLNQMQRGRPG